MGKILAVLEIELILSAFLGGTSDSKAVRFSLPQNRRAKLFVDQDTGLLSGYSLIDRRLEAVVDNLLRVGYLRRLFGRQRACPAKHAGLERAAVIKRQDIE